MARTSCPGSPPIPGSGSSPRWAPDGPVAIGPTGRHHLATGVVEGIDPLAPFGAHAPAMLLGRAACTEAPDLYVNSRDPDTLDVAAFEPLVGCHGGLGGWQDRGFVLAPPDLLAPTAPIVGRRGAAPPPRRHPRTLGHRAELVRSTT